MVCREVFSRDKACQFSALKGISSWSFKEKLKIDDKH